MLTKKKTFAVLGLSTFGYRVAVSLYRDGATVIAVDREETIVQKISPNVSKAITVDLMNWDVLSHIGVLDVDVAVIGLRTSFDVEVILTYNLKKHSDIKTIVAQVDTNEKAEALSLIGADIIVFPEKDMAERIMKRLTVPDLVEYISLTPDTSIIEVAVPQRFVGKSMIDLQIRTKFNIYVVGIKNTSDGGKTPEISIAPNPQTQFKKNDIMLLLGNRKKLNSFMKSIIT